MKLDEVGKAHPIKPLKKQKLPKDFVFFDTETWYCDLPSGEQQHWLRLGWACHWHTGYGDMPDCCYWQYFDTTNQFWDWLINILRWGFEPIVVAHNITFDLTIVDAFRQLPDRGFDLDFFYSKQATTLIRGELEGKPITFADSLNHWLASLKEIGDIVGLPKLDVDFGSVSDEDLSVYCRRDVEILQKAYKDYLQFLVDMELGPYGYTKASQAFKTFRYGYLHKKIYIHRNQRVCDLERRSFTGGRTECFYIGELEGDYYMVDVNSLYPFVMYNNKYPCRVQNTGYKMSVWRLNGLLDKYAVVAEVIVNTQAPIYPLKGNKLIFPIGRFQTVLTTPELRLALSRGDIESVETWSVYDRDYIFSDYVNKLYPLKDKFKQSGQKVYTKLVKDLLNSLFGKFVQKAQEWETVGEAGQYEYEYHHTVDAETGKLTRQRYLFGKHQIERENGEARYSFPAIGSHITGCARCYMWQLMEKAGRENIYYMDTDSLLVNRDGYDNLRDLVNSSKLGYLDLQSRHNRIGLYGPKDYYLDDKIKTKGISKDAEKLDDGVYKQNQWPGMQTVASGWIDGTYRIQQQIKYLERDYQKGLVLDSGLVIPFEFDLDDQNRNVNLSVGDPDDLYSSGEAAPAF